MVARKHYFHLLPENIQNMPSENTFTLDCIGLRKVRNLDITGSIVIAKVLMTRTNPAGCPRVHNKGNVIDTANGVEYYLHHSWKHETIQNQ
jgi:hypothetical protein